MKQRPGDQPLPIKNDLPRCHDMAAARVLRRYTDDGPAGQVVAGLRARLAVGLERYGTALQPRNGRDFHRDLLEELLDALAYGSGLAYEMASENAEGLGELTGRHLPRLEEFAVFLCRLREQVDRRPSAPMDL